MSALTKNERDGLDDVFLSIHSQQDRYLKIKNISTLIMSRSKSINFNNLIKQAKIGLKETNIHLFLSALSKKKKILSK